MGAYAECWLDNLQVTSSKNGVHHTIMNLFRAGDRVVKRSTDPDLPDFIVNQWDSKDDPDHEVFDVVYYCAPAAVVRDRLDLQGYTAANARRLFEEWRNLAIRERQSRDPPSNAEISHISNMEMEALAQLTVDGWIELLRHINKQDLTRKDGEIVAGTFLSRMLERHNSGWYGYDGPDPLIGIRLAIEACPDAAKLIYDLSDLVLSGYVDLDEDPIAQAIDSSAAEYHEFGRTVILTEGRSDALILRSGMDLLYPHLIGYFSFMEFAEFRVLGGAGALANLVKSFAGAGIVNRVIAIFDNDAAASAAVKSLERISLPHHIVLLRLPNFEFLSAYPTLGPTGPSIMDINGMAASIELYLGEDVLRDNQGILTPIQWTGYEGTIGTYQGEVVAKANLQERFIRKIERARADPDFLRAADWTGIRQILTAIFSAFHQLNGEALSRQLSYYYENQIGA